MQNLQTAIVKYVSCLLSYTSFSNDISVTIITTDEILHSRFHKIVINKFSQSPSLGMMMLGRLIHGQKQAMLEHDMRPRNVAHKRR